METKRTTEGSGGCWWRCGAVGPKEQGSVGAAGGGDASAGREGTRKQSPRPGDSDLSGPPADWRSCSGGTPGGS